MKLHKLLILTALSLSLNYNDNAFAKKPQIIKKESSPLEMIEKASAIAVFPAACADAWATDAQDIRKNTKNLIVGIASSVRLINNITTQIINLNSDTKSYTTVAHAPWILFDISQLVGAISHSIENTSQTTSELENLLAGTQPVEQEITPETYASLQTISRQFTAIGEGSAAIAASFLRDRKEAISIFGKKISPKAAREMCYTLSSIMRSGNLLLASKPSLPKAIFAVSLVAYSTLFIYQFATAKTSFVTQAEFEAACKKFNLDPKNLTPEDIANAFKSYLLEAAKESIGLNENIHNTAMLYNFIEQRALEATISGLIEPTQDMTGIKLGHGKGQADIYAFILHCTDKAEEAGLITAGKLRKRLEDNPAKLKSTIQKLFTDFENKQTPDLKNYIQDAIELSGIHEAKNFNDFETVIKGLEPKHFKNSALAAQAPFGSFNDLVKTAISSK